MAIGEKCDFEILHEVFLTDYHLSHFERKDVYECALFLDLLVEFFDVYTFHIKILNLQAMRYKITLSYSGADFCGWQLQKGAPSVQETLQNALGTLLGGPTAVTGAGRTDTGVNAINYVAQFDCSRQFDTSDICYKLNAILPPSVAVSSIEEVAPDFHARFDAKRRKYVYHIHRVKDPFASQYSWLCGYPVLDFDAMNTAAEALLGTHDFSSFEKTGSDNKTSICTVFEARWVRDDESHWTFHIAADRFLRNMVRSIVGTLIEVGRGRRPADSIPALLESRDRCAAGESVPGHALFLC